MRLTFMFDRVGKEKVVGVQQIGQLGLKQSRKLGAVKGRERANFPCHRFAYVAARESREDGISTRLLPRMEHARVSRVKASS